MQLYSKKLELLALYTITLNTDDSSKLLSRLDSAHFHFPATKAAFNRFIHILRTKTEHLDWDSLCEDPALKETDRDVLKSFENPTSASSIDNAFRTLEQYRVGRAIYSMAQHAIESLKEKFEPDQLLDDLADKLLNARTSTEDQKLYHIGVGNNTTSIVKDMLDQSNKPPVIPTGFTDYDEALGGLPDHGVVIIAATTSSGKSTMANQLGLNINSYGYDVCKCSLEMSHEQEIERILSNKSGIPHNKIRNKKLTPQEIKKVKQTYTKFVKDSKKEGRRFTVISPTEDISLTQFFALVKPYNYKVLIIDYISLLKEDSNKEQWKHLSDVAREAKRYSLKTKSLVILLAQLDQDNKIRYSRAIQEHADVVWAWALTDADRENEKFTVNQTKGRNQGLIAFEVGGKFECMQILNAGTHINDDSPAAENEVSDISDLMG